MKKLLILFLLLFAEINAWTQICRIGPSARNELLRTVTGFGESMQKKQKDTLTTNLYVRYKIHVEKRNPTLLVVPSMYPVANGERQFAGESFSELKIYKGKTTKLSVLASKGNIPQNKKVFSIMKTLFVPNVYAETIYNGFILSPCNFHNKRLYKYIIASLSDGRIEMVFRPRVKNAQLVSGKAIIDKKTGKILYVTYRGELDMLEFKTKLQMDGETDKIAPVYSETEMKFKFIGNVVSGIYKVFYGIENTHTDGLNCKKSSDTLIDKLRPLPIDEEMANIYKKQEDKTNTDKKTGKKIIGAWGDYFIDRINGNFGAKSQGTYKVSPIFNPLYIGYSSNKGVTYRMKLSGRYDFSDNSGVALTVNLGYSFKQKQLYMKIPFSFQISKWISVETEFGTGNRITSSDVLDKIKNEKFDSIRWDNMKLDYFKDMYWKVRTNVKLGKKWNARPGIIYHRRSAVDKAGFKLSDEPTEYMSFAPTLQIQFQPLPDDAPVVTFDYERGIKGVMKSKMDYERIETDLAWKRRMHSMKILSLKTGFGFYTSRSKNDYFLDYTNFRYENVPGGWDDDWTGDFQLLNSNWYNASKYYVRGNLTYESPMMVFSKLPLVGRYIETERIYANVLFAEHVNPYVEFGYGLTNKIFSAGIFCATAKTKFEGFGVRFGLELFKDW